MVVPMDVVAGMSDRLPLADVAAYARRVEAMGFDRLHVPETIHDALAVALLALEHTTTLHVQTSVVLALVRSPMLVAYSAWDLQAMSGGRFSLGIGSQIRQNIEERYSVEWREPVGRMREYVEALHAIWQAFATGAPLHYDGEHYRFRRLQPFFNPGPIDQPAPPIWLGGVNAGICALGGSHADGFVTHPTNSSPRYLRELCLPVLRTAEAEAGRPAGSVRLTAGSPLATGAGAADVAASREHHRRLLGFLLSTPAYRRSLELFGWSDVGERLQRMTRDQAWGELAAVVTDEVLDAFVPQATWDDLPNVIASWFAGLADGVILPVPTDPADDDRFASVVGAVRDV
jgi:probable F420-dependent oxidoreductase